MYISEFSNPVTSFDFESNKYHLMLASGVMNSEDIEASEPIFNQQATFGITKEKINLKQSRVGSFIMSIYIRINPRINQIIFCMYIYFSLKGSIEYHRSAHPWDEDACGIVKGCFMFPPQCNVNDPPDCAMVASFRLFNCNKSCAFYTFLLIFKNM